MKKILFSIFVVLLAFPVLAIGETVYHYDSSEEETDVDRGGYYDLQLQNIPDLAAKGAGYWFDGSNDVITVADNANWNSASLELRVQMQRLTLN